MKLYIMRHGPAEDRATSGRDGDRCLTRDGSARVRSVASALAQRGEAPKEIVSSPLVRARETAAIVATLVAQSGASADVHAVAERGELSISGANIRGLVSELLAAGRRRVMLVGHEPSLSDFVETDLGVRLAGGMTKAMVVGVRVRPATDPGSARNGWEVRPRFVLDPKALTWHDI